MTITAFDIWLVGSLDGIRAMFWYGAIFFGVLGMVFLERVEPKRQLFPSSFALF